MPKRPSFVDTKMTKRDKYSRHSSSLINTEYHFAVGSKARASAVQLRAWKRYRITILDSIEVGRGIPSSRDNDRDDHVRHRRDLEGYGDGERDVCMRICRLSW